MNKELSSNAQFYLSWLNEDSLIDPDDWHFNISTGGKRIHCTPQLTRDLVRKPLIEINKHKPKLLSPILKKEYNLLRIADKNDLNPTKEELSRLEKKIKKLSEDHYLTYDIEHLMKDPGYKMENTIISAWMIDIQDVIDFLKGEPIENIYNRVNERRKKIDSP